jgi:hypothetical protein
MSLLKGSKMLKTKSEIKEKLEEAETALKRATVVEEQRLVAVVVTLRWVLGVKTTQDPKDPLTVA